MCAQQKDKGPYATHRDEVQAAKNLLLAENQRVALQLPAPDIIISNHVSELNIDIPQIFHRHIISRYMSDFYSCADSTWPRTAVVDFANPKFGGGLLETGLYQEEKLLLETNCASVVAEGGWNKLDQSPIVLKALHTHRFINRGRRLYGRDSLRAARIDKGNISYYYEEVPGRKREIAIVAMAAANMKERRQNYYGFDDYEGAFQVTYKAFKTLATVSGKEVHTGAWGCGDFGNSENVMAVLQILAAQAAGVQLYYHNPDRAAYDSAIRFLKRQKGKTYRELFKALGDRQNDRSNGRFWRPSR